MLLQAVVRERANRALEGLLAATRTHELLLGKLMGVALVSAMIIAAWLGFGALIAATPLAGASAGMSGMLLSGFTNPGALLMAGAIYLAAFAMYGAAIIGVGALARDVASAQNLARPVFGVLLLVFFAALGQLTAPGSGPGWLLWAPPFTPFVLLMTAPGTLSALQVALAFVLMAGTAWATAVAASAALKREGQPFERRRRGTPQRRADDVERRERAA
jgi:ABC-2 type transport system permease protein